MDGLEFISSLVASLVWPITVVVLAFLFRRSLQRFLSSGRVRRWRAGPSGVEVEYWDEVAEEARAGLPEKPPPAETTRPSGPTLREELKGLAQDHPSEAIEEAFRQVERVLRKRVEPHAPEASRAPGATGVAAIAAAQGIIDRSLFSTIEGLAVLRNLAAHTTSARDLSPGKAMEFLDLADAAIYSIGQSPS